MTDTKTNIADLIRSKDTWVSKATAELLDNCVKLINDLGHEPNQVDDIYDTVGEFKIDKTHFDPLPEAGLSFADFHFNLSLQKLLIPGKHRIVVHDKIFKHVERVFNCIAFRLSDEEGFRTYRDIATSRSLSSADWIGLILNSPNIYPSLQEFLTIMIGAMYRQEDEGQSVFVINQKMLLESIGCETNAFQVDAATVALKLEIEMLSVPHKHEFERTTFRQLWHRIDWGTQTHNHVKEWQWISLVQAACERTNVVEIVKKTIIDYVHGIVNVTDEVKETLKLVMERVEWEPVMSYYANIGKKDGFAYARMVQVGVDTRGAPVYGEDRGYSQQQFRPSADYIPPQTPVNYAVRFNYVETILGEGKVDEMIKEIIQDQSYRVFDSNQEVFDDLILPLTHNNNVVHYGFGQQACFSQDVRLLQSGAERLLWLAHAYREWRKFNLKIGIQQEGKGFSL